MMATPAQTIGPFFGYALPIPGGGDLAAPADSQAIVIRGTVYDGAGVPVPDALIEIWQPAPDGSLRGAPGTLRRVTGAAQGRTGVDFTGFARIATDAYGQWFVRTLSPGPHRPGATPCLAVCVFARGLLRHLHTRIYLPEHAAGLDTDAVLGGLEPARRATLLAVAERRGVYRFDIRLQGGIGSYEETVFFDFA